MNVVRELLELSHELGSSSLAILAEGNASAADGDTLWIKASGCNLASLTGEQLVQVELESALRLLATPTPADSLVRQALSDMRASPASALLPSVETFMHAYLLTLPGVRFVAHTHPTSLLSLLCLPIAAEQAEVRLFPDEIVCCGPASAFVPYVDPGLPLAVAIRDSVSAFIGRWNEAPKTIWLQNHGLIALGTTAKEALAATLMSDKAAQIRLQALATGHRLTALSPDNVERIHKRPDEQYRKKLLWSSEQPQ